jgi:arylsulfatase A-like enzyme
MSLASITPDTAKATISARETTGAGIPVSDPATHMTTVAENTTGSVTRRRFRRREPEISLSSLATTVSSPRRYRHRIRKYIPVARNTAGGRAIITAPVAQSEAAKTMIPSAASPSSKLFTERIRQQHHGQRKRPAASGFRNSPQFVPVERAEDTLRSGTGIHRHRRHRPRKPRLVCTSGMDSGWRLRLAGGQGLSQHGGMKALLISLLFAPLLFAAEKPRNVVFILVDDLGVTDVNLDGSDPFYETPNIAKFAKTAVNFTNGYASCPVCSPTRSAIMTGQNPARTHHTDYFGAANQFLGEIPADYDPVRDFLKSGKDMKGRGKHPVLPAPYLGNLSQTHTTLPEALKKQGYSTFFAGKWHLGREGNYPQDHGFDINIGGAEGGGPYGGKKYFSPYANPQIKDGPPGEHLTERLGRETADFIKASRDKPFLAYLSFYSVHTPLMAPDHVVKKYQAKREKLGLKDEFQPQDPRMNRTVHSHAIYAAMIETMDAACGQVFDALEAEGLVENTLVIFTSDNGGLSTSEGSPTSNLPYRAGKGWLYEGGIRVPVFVRDPATGHAGETCAEPVYSTDYYPTILAATGHGLLPEQHKDGVSFLPFLENPDMKPSVRPLIWHYPHWGNQGGSPGDAIREGKWKLIRWDWPERTELFDLDSDPGESKNLASENLEIAGKLAAQIESFLSEAKAYRTAKNPDFKGEFRKW